MWSFIKRAYRDSAQIMVALPALFALAAGTEFIQHVIEQRIGMFESFESAEATAGHAARMGFGQVKILSLILLLYWVSRWQAYRDRPDRSVLGDRRSALLFLGVVLLGIALGLVQQFGGALLSPLVSNPRALLAIGLAYFAASFALEIYLTGWKVGAALGNSRLSIPASFRIMHGNFWWSLGFSIVMILPLMVLHYALNIIAIGKAAAPLWAILAADALVVGYLGLVLATTSFLIAQRATQRAEVPLAES